MLNYPLWRGGTVFYAPLRVRVAPGRFREPDLVLLLDVNDPRNQNAFWLGADLAVGIVSPDYVERDTVIKRADYAEAGIPEYWIVNPEDETITVLKLDELLTLLKMRENYRVAVAAGEALREQRVARIEHVTIEDSARSWEVFRQYHDKDWSFTDCTSKVMIERLRLIYAFAFDNHFEQFGTVTHVP